MGRRILDEARRLAREAGKPEVYTVEVNGKSFVVQVNEGGDIEGLKPVGAAGGATPAAAPDGPACCRNPAAHFVPPADS